MSEPPKSTPRLERPAWGPVAGHHQEPAPLQPQGIGASREQLHATGVFWDSESLPWHVVGPAAGTNGTMRVLARYLATLPGFVYDAAALEGNPFTLPEVQTLVDGVTVGGRRVEDANQVQALIEAHRELASLVRNSRFTLTKTTSDHLHRLVARLEALESGHFRGEGAAGGGGSVRLGGDVPDYQASTAGLGGATLRAEHDSLLDHVASLSRASEQALVYFVAATRRQFYFDGNKRTARLMMNGLLLSTGHDAISVPFRRRLEFNTRLRTLFTSGDATGLIAFLLDCAPSSTGESGQRSDGRVHSRGVLADSLLAGFPEEPPDSPRPGRAADDPGRF